MSAPELPLGQEAIQVKGWFAAHRWLLLRRLLQIVFLAVFLTGPWFGVWIAKGNLSASLTFDVLPLTDPLLLLQSLVAGHWPSATLLIGAAIVTLAYLLVGGRAYCAYVCPINPVTDLAHWLRGKLGLRDKGWQPKPATRLWLLLAVLAASAITGTLALEAINPISLAHRGIIFGLSAGWVVIAGVFLFDLLLARHGWCGHLCPAGAFWGLLGRASLLRISATGRADCNNCMECYAICPEPQVITPALKGAKTQTSPVILDGACTNCGRCADICARQVFIFTHRFNESERPQAATQQPTGGVTG